MDSAWAKATYQATKDVNIIYWKSLQLHFIKHVPIMTA